MKIITISREFGSGGREVGKRLADALGFRYYDKEIIAAVSERVSQDEGYMEHTIRAGITPQFSMAYGHSFSRAAGFDGGNDIRLLAVEQQIIRELALSGDCVMVGRTANIILEQYHPLNLFVYAETEAKVRRCQERMTDPGEMTRQEIKRRMRQIDAGRAKHQKLLTEQKWGHKEGYHLCVNTTDMQIKSMIPAVRAFAECWFNGNVDERN